MKEAELRPIESRDYQERLVEKTFLAFFEQLFKSVLLESPTGSGKTIVALLILKRLEEVWPQMRFGWVAMRRKLLAQAQKENERIGVKNISFISMFDKNAPKCDLMITDECQHDAAATCAELHKNMGAKLSLGLTATPFRTDRIKLSYDKIINDCGVRFLIEKGYLSGFQQWVIPKWTPQDVARHFLVDPEKWGKSVIYMKNLDLCDEVTQILQEGGVKAEVIHGGQNRATQDRIYDDFESGALQALVNVYLLTEGFDAPDLNTVWVRDSGKLCTMQMSGRVLRKDPENPEKVANIVQSEQTYFPYTRVAKASAEYIWQEDRWLSIASNDLIEKIAKIVQERILTMPISLPVYLEDSYSRSVRVTKTGEVVLRKQKRKKRTSTLEEIQELLDNRSIFDRLPEDLDDADREAGA